MKKFFIKIQKTPIDEHKLLKFVKDNSCGAVVLFLGTARNINDGKKVKKLYYETYTKMAIVKIKELVKMAQKRFDICKVAVVHRIGEVQLGETSIGIACSSVHRSDAYKTSRFLIDELKRVVPIWKKEYFTKSSKWISK